MKQTIKIVIGSIFGDEGKGLMTDYFCKALSEMDETLNVRFNGGAQAGHTVVTPDGLRHVFNHIGSGSFNKRVVTYLSPQFIINPILFRKEYEGLVNKGIEPEVYAHPGCIVTFPCDMMINQIVEKARGNDKHGSCGVGIYETIVRNQSQLYSPLYGVDRFPAVIAEAIATYVPARLKELGVDSIPVDSMTLLNNENILRNYFGDLSFFLDHVTLKDETIYQRFNHIVFEGAQGLLLDKDNRDYFPHLTPSKTGLANVNQQISMIPVHIDKDIEACFVTRSYFTRHGVGKFLTECEKDNIAGNLVDLTNHTNEFQGNFRYGYFDFQTFKTAIEKEISIMRDDCKPSIAVTHLDETKGRLVTDKDKGITPRMLEAGMKIPVKYTSEGMTRNTITAGK